MLINTDLYGDVGLSGLEGVVDIERVGVLHLHVNCVHSYIDMYGAIGLLVLKGIVDVDRMRVSHLFLTVFTNTQAFMMLLSFGP